MLEEITKTLTAPLPNTHYTFRVMVVNDPIVNALAAPGGYILVFRGLLDRTRSPEELAGVLAHESQHVLKRHTTRALLENVSSGLLVAALMGERAASWPSAWRAPGPWERCTTAVRTRRRQTPRGCDCSSRPGSIRPG
jgi:predicted Zn-dependent protease